jgi:hypothetical protein
MERAIKILIIVVVLGIIGYVTYAQIGKWNKKRLDTALKQEQEEWQKKTDNLEGKIAELQEELAQQRDELIPKEKLVEVFGEETEVISPEKKEVSCEELERQIMAFFTYLDKKEYIKSYKLDEGTYELFMQMVNQLSKKPPIVTGEMKDLANLIRNMAHFYRVVGKKGIELSKMIIRNEPEVIEPVMAALFGWFTAGNCCNEKTKGCPSFEILYEYAGFFLNTLAGKSYLLRRDSKVRILTSYYCVLIVDRANDETLNRHGIDIRPHIDFLFYDIINQRVLVNKKQYLGKLVSLKEKYKR